MTASGQRPPFVRRSGRFWHREIELASPTMSADRNSSPEISREPARSRLQLWWAAAAAKSQSTEFLALLGVVCVLLVALFRILSPMLSDFHTFGFHDWDSETSYRYITKLSLSRYHQAPWWNPWVCGGFTAFGDVEDASNFLSPYLPLYLLTDVRVALRLEVIGAALTGLTGAFLLGRRFTRSVALCGFFAAVYVLNGRWALQAAAGHTWHLQYGLMPWAFWFFERALERDRLRNTIGAGAVIACMVSWGGIYPLPHTALLLSVYALLLAIGMRSTRPIIAVALTGIIAIGLSAPKLFAIIDHMSDVPRLIESKEVIGVSELLVMLTDSEQRFGSHPVRTPAYNWHEWGIYIGWSGVIALCIAIVFARDVRGQALKIVGLFCLLLGFGAFHERAPWTLLHKLPVFASQHVPSRFHYSMLLFLGAAFLTVVGRHVEALAARLPWLELLLLAPLAWFCLDLASVSVQPMQQAFWMEAPDAIVSRPFEQHVNPVVNYKRRDWAPPELLAMMANTGVIKGYGIDPKAVPAAVGVEDRAYRGTVYVDEGPGQAEVADWSPNVVTVNVSHARPGSIVIYNMNFDSSWRADGAPALNWHGLVAARVNGESQHTTFSYRPRTLVFSIPLALITMLACAWWCGLFERFRAFRLELRRR